MESNIFPRDFFFTSLQAPKIKEFLNEDSKIKYIEIIDLHNTYPTALRLYAEGPHTHTKGLTSSSTEMLPL